MHKVKYSTKAVVCFGSSRSPPFFLSFSFTRLGDAKIGFGDGGGEEPKKSFYPRIKARSLFFLRKQKSFTAGDIILLDFILPRFEHQSVWCLLMNAKDCFGLDTLVGLKHLDSPTCRI